MRGSNFFYDGFEIEAGSICSGGEFRGFLCVTGEGGWDSGTLVLKGS